MIFSMSTAPTRNPKRYMTFSYGIHCRGCGKIEIHHSQLVSLDHEQRKRHQGTNQRIPQAAERPKD